ncbi:hypothetical protein D3C75_1360990 [compost metagenome]
MQRLLRIRIGRARYRIDLDHLPVAEHSEQNDHHGDQIGRGDKPVRHFRNNPEGAHYSKRGHISQSKYDLVFQGQ